MKRFLPIALAIGLLAALSLPLAAYPPYRPPYRPPTYRPPVRIEPPRMEPPRFERPSYERPGYDSTGRSRSGFELPGSRGSFVGNPSGDHGTDIFGNRTGSSYDLYRESAARAEAARIRREAEVYAARVRREGEVREARAAVDQAMKEVTALAERGSWEKAAALADRTLGSVRGYSEVETGPLRRIADSKRVADALDRVEDFLGRGGAASEIPSGADLPDAARRAFDGFRRLNALREETDRRWKRAPDINELTAAIGDLRASPETRPLGDRLARELAVKAFLSGHPAEANRIVERTAGPEKGSPSPEDRAAHDLLLRDIVAVVVGEGEVKTWPAAAALAADNPGEGNHPTRGPPAVARMLLPDADASGYRPPVIEKATADLPSPTAALAPLVEARRAETKESVRAERETLKADRTKALAEARRYKPAASPTVGNSGYLPPQGDGSNWQLILPGGSDDEDKIAEVERLVGRPLTVAERGKVRLYRFSSASEIALILRKPSFRFLKGDLDP